jgi:hypothetical protein
MAHFAQIDDNNVVMQVVVVANQNITDATGQEQEQLGIAFMQDLLGPDTRWVQTSYNANFRGKYAGIGDLYDVELDEFVTPAPEPVRARNADGTFMADDPATPDVDEAWVTTA